MPPMRRGMRLAVIRFRYGSAPSPVTSNFAKLEKSITPTRSRTARHSVATTSKMLLCRKPTSSSRPSSENHFGRSQPLASVYTQPFAASLSNNGLTRSPREAGRSSPGRCSAYMCS